jgi:hypothetical protein
MGWKVRALTEKEIRGGMSGQELIWHQTFSPAAVEQALTLPAEIASNEKNQAALEVRKKWNKEMPVTDDEKKKMADVAKQFLRLYPQFISSDANVDAIWDYQQEHNLDPAQLSSPIEAFESLAQSGKISLNPSAISAGPESSVSGRELTGHHSFHLLLQRQRRTSDVDKLSADEYFEKNKDVLADKRMPFIVAVRQERAANTAAHEKTTEAVTAASGSTKVIDYPQGQHGVPPQPEKVSFRKKINSMTADEIQQECAINPGFRKSLDEME